MSTVSWYFDFVSPYAYFGLQALDRLPAGTSIQFEPVLFAGLLNHWGQKGPAEIPPKRIWTYRACVWWATQHRIPFCIPAAHPFNSLAYLRLSIAAGNSLTAIQTIFRQLWTTGADPADPGLIASLAKTLDVSPRRLGDADIKSALRSATEDAARRGVFGVPTIRIGEQLFWGSDVVEFAAQYLLDPLILETDAMKRADATPIGAARAGSS